MGSFNDDVLSLVNKVPKGNVVSYGQVAAALGNPRAAREVGWALHALDGAETDIPWWRVVNKEGYISIRGNDIATKDLQKRLLEKDGVIVDVDYKIDMEKYRYNIKV